MTNKWFWIGASVLILIAFLVWLFVESSKPVPGSKLADLGRKHVPKEEKVEYNSNPPTSGSHDAEWIRSGVYSEPKDDRNLVHSLEHGYVILSYNCNLELKTNNLPSVEQNSKLKTKLSNLKLNTVYAHGVEEEASSSAEATSSSTLSDSFRSEQCHQLVDQLISIYEKKGKTRLIVIPRPNLDARIALTAWNYLDKFDPSTHSTNSGQASSGLSVNELERIEKFIDAHLNQGPEKTKE